MKTRNTIQRTLVFESLKKMLNHPTAEDICDDVRKTYPDISLATVYRNLSTLEQLGDVYKIPIANGADRFDINLDGHHHVICEVCGYVSDVTVDIGTHAQRIVSQTTGYEDVRQNVLFVGTCPDCSAKQVAL